MSAAVRLKHLSDYLQVLIGDVATNGNFAAVGADPVEAAAKAILSGAGSLWRTMWTDIKTLAGLGKDATILAARPIAQEAAARGVGWLLDKISKL